MVVMYPIICMRLCIVLFARLLGVAKNELAVICRLCALQSDIFYKRNYLLPFTIVSLSYVECVSLWR